MNDQAESSSKKKELPKKEDESEEEQEERFSLIDWSKKWNVEFKSAQINSSPEDASKEIDEKKEEFPVALLNFDYSDLLSRQFFSTHSAHDLVPLRQKILWHSALGFEKSPANWYPLYAIDERIVIAQREMGKGRIVLVSDSYPFSNEVFGSIRNPNYYRG